MTDFTIYDPCAVCIHKQPLSQCSIGQNSGRALRAETCDHQVPQGLTRLALPVEEDEPALFDGKGSG
jgi:hypothetical protein